MARNSDFKKVVVKDVELLWPRLDQTYRYNSQDKVTEACEPGANGAQWSVGFKLPLERAGELKKELLAHYAEAAASNKKLPKDGTIFGAKRMTDADGGAIDFVQFTAKKRAVSNDGKPNKKPQVVGPDLSPLEGDEAAIWTGSIGSIRALAFPTVDPDGKGGISLLLDAVQVTEPVYGGDTLEDDFGPARKPSLDDLADDEPAQTKPKAPPAPAEAANLDF